MTSAVRSSAILPGEPYSPEKIATIAEQFHRDGYIMLGPVLEPEEVEALKSAMERKYADPSMHDDEEGDYIRNISLMRMFEYDTAFRDVIVHEPLVSLAEALVGHDCHIISQNALRNGFGEGVTGWHVDGPANFPLPPDVPRHDPRIQMPCFVANFMFLLTDVEELKYGPTQVVPGSHYSGRQPDTQDNPHFEGKGPVSLFGKAGDTYIFNNQIWHRGVPNSSDRVRYAGGVTYGQRNVAQRFYPFLNYRMPDHVLEGASPRLLRLLGKHGKGAYG